MQEKAEFLDESPQWCSQRGGLLRWLMDRKAGELMEGMEDKDPGGGRTGRWDRQPGLQVSL
jgi:hypothetical protein